MTARKKPKPKKPAAKPKAAKPAKPTKVKLLLAVSSEGQYMVFDPGERLDAKGVCASWNEQGQNAALHALTVSVAFPRPPKRPQWAKGLALTGEVAKSETHSVPDENERQLGLPFLPLTPAQEAQLAHLEQQQQVAEKQEARIAEARRKFESASHLSGDSFLDGSLDGSHP